MCIECNKSNAPLSISAGDIPVTFSHRQDYYVTDKTRQLEGSEVPEEIVVAVNYFCSGPMTRRMDLAAFVMEPDFLLKGKTVVPKACDRCSKPKIPFHCRLIVPDPTCPEVHQLYLISHDEGSTERRYYCPRLSGFVDSAVPLDESRPNFSQCPHCSRESGEIFNFLRIEVGSGQQMTEIMDHLRMKKRSTMARRAERNVVVSAPVPVPKKRVEMKKRQKQKKKA